MTTNSNATDYSRATSTDNPAGGAENPCTATEPAIGTTTPKPHAATENPTPAAAASAPTTAPAAANPAPAAPTDSYTAPATNNAKEATVTTNDQPSPTHPTQTPPSEPESSTGPDQLEWDEQAGGYHLTAKVSHGNYAAYFGDAFENPHRWHTVYWREEQSICNPTTTCHLYRGDDLDEALAAAQQHHQATLRRLAWEQYMRDNDPPNRPIDILLTQCDKATVEANIARQALGLR